MNNNQIEHIAQVIYSSLIDGIDTSQQVAEKLMDYPAEYREEIEDVFYDYLDAEKSCVG